MRQSGQQARILKVTVGNECIYKEIAEESRLVRFGRAFKDVLYCTQQQTLYVVVDRL